MNFNKTKTKISKPRGTETERENNLTASEI